MVTIFETIFDASCEIRKLPFPCILPPLSHRTLSVKTRIWDRARLAPTILTMNSKAVPKGSREAPPWSGSEF